MRRLSGSIESFQDLRRRNFGKSHFCPAAGSRSQFQQFWLNGLHPGFSEQPQTRPA